MTDISIAPLQIHYYPRLQHWYCVGVNPPKRYRQLWVKVLPKVPTWRLEVGLELASFRTQGTEPTTEPPGPVATCDGNAEKGVMAVEMLVVLVRMITVM